MKNILIEISALLAILFIAYKSISWILGSKIVATSRTKIFYSHVGLCGVPFAMSAWSVLPHLSTALNFYSRSSDWSKLIQFGGGYMILILVSGALSIVFAYSLFKSISKEESIWELLKLDNNGATYLLSGILVSSGVMFATIACEIAKIMIPYATIPFNY